jgi:putative ABC transport system permease protein
MLRNYFFVALRHLTRNRIHSAINIVGLATGMTVTILIGLWVWDELNFDHYHKTHSRLAEIISVDNTNAGVDAGTNASVPVAAELRSKYRDDIRATAATAPGSFLLKAGDKKIQQWGCWAQGDFPAMFTLKMLSGSREALRNPSSMLISRSVARALFGDSDPINKSVFVGDSTAMKVGGVYEDLPRNTSLFWTAVLLPWDNPDNPAYGRADDWTDHHSEVYVQLADGADADKVTDKIKDLTKPHLPGGWETLLLHPMDRWHLYTRYENGRMIGDRLRVVLLFAIIGGFVLLLACINFMNLSTARSERRAKEVGIRKTIGGLRSQLIGQFLGESVLTAFIALLLALVMAQLAIPFFDNLSGKQLTIPWDSPLFWLAVTGFVLLTGLVAGSYPAFYLSGFEVVKVLKGAFHAGRWSSLPRKVLVVLQFTISVILIIATIVVLRQIGYAEDRPVGYDRAGLLTVEMKSPQLVSHYAALRDDLLSTGVVAGVTTSSSPSTQVQNAMVNYDWEGRATGFMPVGTVFVDADYGRTLGWKIIDGRDFSRDFPGDSGASASFGAASPRSSSPVTFAGSVILNEAAVRMTGFRHPVGSMIRWHGQEWPVIGVVKDMVMESPYNPVGPTFFTLLNRKIHVLTLRIRAGASMHTALAQIETVFKRYNPDSPFDYEFTDEVYGLKFADEKLVGRLATVFAALAIFISCLGLFGLASFVAEQRTREIGVRKVLGATVLQLWGLLSREFAVLVVLSCLIAAPVAWLFLHQWLQQYAYRTGIPWWSFVGTGVAAMAITLLTVSWQAVRAARVNPAESLRSE